MNSVTHHWIVSINKLKRKALLKKTSQIVLISFNSLFFFFLFLSFCIQLICFGCAAAAILYIIHCIVFSNWAHCNQFACDMFSVDSVQREIFMWTEVLFGDKMESTNCSRTFFTLVWTFIWITIILQLKVTSALNSTPPNVIIILTDDQDVVLNGMVSSNGMLP